MISISDFTLNGVVIKTPQALSISTVIERQRVILLNGKPKERIKRVYRVATLSFSMIENEKLQTIIAETLTKAVTDGATTVAESVMNNRWSEIEDLVFEEV